MRALFIVGIAIIQSFFINAQGCCSGGGGTPLAGGAAASVLQEGQLEILSTLKYSRSNKFLSGRQDTIPFFDNLTSNYLFFKVDYGVSDKLTLSLATGYYLNRTITEFADTSFIGTEMRIENNKIASSGFGDLIIFPRYSVLEKNKGLNRTELSLGLGLKIPIGMHNDSNFVDYALVPNNVTNTFDSVEIWQTSPPTVQSTTGSNDLMFYAFFLKSYPQKNLKFFTSALYVHKGWNSLGLKFGDYASVGLYAGTNIFNKLGLLAQLKGEWVGRLQSLEGIDILAEYSIDEESTGSTMLSFVPQITYSFDKLPMSIFTTANIPLSQNLRGMQIASQYQITAGISYRFFVKKKIKKEIIDDGSVIYKEDSFRVWGNCDMCKETIENTLNEILGIKYAEWNVETQTLKIQYDPLSISLDKVKTQLAKIGYDTETHRASNKAYNNLHACCKYERP